MKHFAIAGLAVVALSGCLDDDDNNNTAPPQTEFSPSETYTVTLTGGQQVPANMSMQTATATVEYDEAKMQIRASIDLSEVSDVQAIHIHDGDLGFNGPVEFPFTGDGNGGFTIEPIGVTEDFVAELRDGDYYINVHTTDFPDGELRGQIVGDNVMIATFPLTGSQEVPAVTTSASGHGYAAVNTSTFDVNLVARTEGVDDATMAHIHTGRIGMNGPVLVALEQNADDAGVWTTPAGTQIDADTLAVLASGGHYVNIHTPAHPGGELRGQIVTDNFILTTFGLSGSQEVPAVETDGSGDGYALIDTSTLSVELVAVTDGLDDITMAHIHTGRIGMNGDVLVALEQGTDANVWMTPENTVIDQDTFEVLASGGHYVNIHTATVPSGEVRGQIVTNDFVVATFPLSGEQEVPAVSTSATGDGYALVNTNTFSVELVAVTEGVDDATMAHIHTGRIGMNGPVLVGLEQSADDAGVWMTPANTLIDAETFAVLASGGHYVNVHTPANPGGELRGQILTDDYVMVTFPITGGQQVPTPVVTSASGDGYALVNTSSFALELVAVTQGVEDATMAHIHTGSAGQNGPVLVNLEQSADDVNVWMTPADTSVTAEIFALLASGGHYVNVHTPEFPDGEIRGQIE